jgi:drug/metabolite transporter (DMT)-like permease
MERRRGPYHGRVMQPAHLAQLLLLSLLWGGSYLFMRSAAPAFGPAPMIFLRMTMGCLLVLLPLTLWRVGWRAFVPHGPALLWMGLAFTAVPFLGLGYSALSIGAGMLAVLQSAAPLFTALVARVWLGEPIGRVRGLGLLIGFAGVSLLVHDRIGALDDATWAILITLAVTGLWGVSSNFVKVRLSRADPLVVSTAAIGLSALASAPFALADWPQQWPGPVAWAEVAFLGVASSGLGFIIFYRLIKVIGPVKATSVTFLNPVVAMASAAVYLDEPVTWTMAAGCAVILIGTALTLGLLPWRSAAASPTAAVPAAPTVRSTSRPS